MTPETVSAIINGVLKYGTITLGVAAAGLMAQCIYLVYRHTKHIKEHGEPIIVGGHHPSLDKISQDKYGALPPEEPISTEQLLVNMRRVSKAFNVER